MTPEDVSKFIAYVLRHAPESVGLRLDAEGWADIDALVAGAVAGGRRLTRPDVVLASTSGAKKRYELSGDGQRIRALQGHSTPQVSRSFEAVVPPDRLFHGTATRFLDAIRAQGLLPGTRQHVHLSADEATAVLVGQRHGVEPDVLVDVLNASSGRNNATERKLRQFVLSRTFASGFELDLMVKDLRIALAMAVDAQVPPGLTAQSLLAAGGAQAGLEAGADHTAVVRWLEQQSGSELHETAAPVAG